MTHAVWAEPLFIAGEGEYDLPLLRPTSAHNLFAEPYMQCSRTFAIIGAKASNGAVSEGRFERVARPIASLADIHRVNMAVESELWRARTGARDQVVDTLGSAQRLAGIARVLEARTYIGTDFPRVARRIG